MATQLLVNVISATVPAGAINHPVAHGLRSNDVPVAPTLVLPQAQSAVTVASVDDTNIYLANSSEAPVAVTFRVERGLSNEVDADTLPLFVMSPGGGGSSGVDSVSVTAPITNSGTATEPNIGVSVGSTAGTVCAGDDARLSNERVPVNGSVTDAKVATANKDGTAATPSMRTLGTGSQQACAGDDARLSNSRTPSGAAGGDLAGTYPNPSLVATGSAGTYGSSTSVPVITTDTKGRVTSVTTTAIPSNAPAATASLRTLGTGATEACAGNDARLSDERVPVNGSVTDAKVATANKDGLAAVPSMRTLGTGAQQACAGNDSRLSDERVPVNGSVTDAKVATANKDGLAAVPSMRTLGTGAQQACAGNDARLSNTRTPTPLSPSPAGTYGSSTSIPVFSVNSAGQITSCSPQDIPTYAVRINGEFVSSSGNFSTSPVYIPLQSNDSASFTQTADKIRIWEANFYGGSYLENTGSLTASVGLMITDQTGTTNYGSVTVFVPPGSKISIPLILNTGTTFSGPRSYSGIRLKMTGSGATLLYSVLSAGYIRFTE